MAISQHRNKMEKLTFVSFMMCNEKMQTESGSRQKVVENDLTGMVSDEVYLGRE